MSENKEKKKKEKQVEILVSLSPEIYEQLRELKEKYGIKYSEFIRSAVIEKLSRFKQMEENMKKR